jgi:membrane-associated phospholipid phosphatase
VRASIVLVLIAVASPGGAQPSPPTLALPHDTLGSPLGLDRRPEIGRNTAVLMTGALGVGLAVSLFDSRLLAGTQHWGGDHTELQRTSAIGSIIGGPGPITVGALLWAGGRGTGDTFMTNTGREVIRAVLVSGGLTALTKGIVGRSRPLAAPGDPDEYSPGRGFLNSARSSFPSGHTSAAFAAATVLAREIDAAHPNARWFVNPLLFGGAAFVGWSRIYDQQHWPSDVLVGAALGTITGYEVVAHAHGDRSPISSGFLSHLRLGPSRKGLDVGWSLR